MQTKNVFSWTWVITTCLLLAVWLGLFTQSCPAAPQNQRANVRKKPLVLAHYMPWYTAKPFAPNWGWHWTMNHFDPEKEQDGKREIASKYYPLIGPYDSGDPIVLEYHLLLMKMAGIEGVIVDWYGLTSFRDYALLHRNTTRMLQQCEKLQMKFVICYEDQTIPALVKGKKLESQNRVAHAVKEIDWLGKYWFKSPSYVKHDGKPVLLSFGHAGLKAEEWALCLGKIQSPVAYFSQDIRRKGAVGGFGWPAPKVGMKQVDRFLGQARKWPAAIPAAFPRFDDIYREAKVGEGYPRIRDREGETLRQTLQKAIRSDPPFIQVATWNDWGEGTQVEPSREHGYRDLETIRTQIHGVDDGQSRNGIYWKVPHQLYKARRNPNADTKVLDSVSKLIRNGDLEQAIEKLKTLPGG